MQSGEMDGPYLCVDRFLNRHLRCPLKSPTHAPLDRSLHAIRNKRPGGRDDLWDVATGADSHGFRSSAVGTKHVEANRENRSHKVIIKRLFRPHPRPRRRGWTMLCRDLLKQM